MSLTDTRTGLSKGRYISPTTDTQRIHFS